MDARAAGQAGLGFGPLLRHWRQRRALSQMALALQAGVSTRHLSWLETGRAEPSRAMVLRLAAPLEVPPRECNALLAAAGYAPMYAERPLGDVALAPARAALQHLLDAHEPWPALAVDRHWNLLAHNRMVPLLLQGVDPALMAPQPNLLRLLLHPGALAPRVAQLPAWRAHVLQRLQRQATASGDATLQALHAELQSLPLAASPPPQAEPEAAPAHDDRIALPLVLHTPQGPLRFLTTVTVFGAPHDLTLAELAVETLLPADEATAARLRAAHAALPP